MIIKRLQQQGFDFGLLPEDIRSAVESLYQMTAGITETENQKINVLDRTIFDSIVVVMPDNEIVNAVRTEVEASDREINNDGFNTTGIDDSTVVSEPDEAENYEAKSNDGSGVSEEVLVYHGEAGVGVHEAIKKFNNLFVITDDEPAYVEYLARHGNKLAKYVRENHWENKFSYSTLVVKEVLKGKYDGVKILNSHLKGLYTKPIEYHDFREGRYKHWTPDKNYAREYAKQTSRKIKHEKGDVPTIEQLKAEAVEANIPKGGARGLMGADGFMLAPNGNKSNLTPEQWRLVRTPEFKMWFGDFELSPETASKVVDENGEPLAVYHGTKNDFYEFKAPAKSMYHGWHFFTDDKERAEVVAEFIGGNRVIPVFLNIRNPIVRVNVQSFAKENKPESIPNDGATQGNPPSTFIVKDSTQIKLADGTNTTFDGSNPDIRMEAGGSMAGKILVRVLTSHGECEMQVDESLSEDDIKNAIATNYPNNMGYYVAITEKKDKLDVTTMQNGGDMPQVNNVLDLSQTERKKFILSILSSNKFYSGEKATSDLMSDKANEFIELYFIFNRKNPVHTKYGDMAFFEPDKKHIDREGYLIAQVEYALHFITSDSHDKSRRFYDSSKVRSLYLVMPILLTPDEKYIQKNNNSVVYSKRIEHEKYCCSILKTELEKGIGLRVVTILPDQTGKSIHKKKASGRWKPDASISRYTEKPPSDVAQPSINGGINDTESNNKDNNNPEYDKKKSGGSADVSKEGWSEDHKATYELMCGMLNNPEMPVEERAGRLIALYENDLIPHFQKEERETFSVRKDDTSLELYGEHLQAHQLIDQIRQYKREADVKAFCRLLKQHIEKEEKYFQANP